MDNKIYLRELACFINLTNEEKQKHMDKANRVFDLGKIKNEKIREEMRSYILERGTTVKITSMTWDIFPFNQLCQILNDRYLMLETFKDFDMLAGKKQCKIWLLENGKNITQRRRRTSTGKDETIDADVITYLSRIVKFFNKEDEMFHFDRDRWYLNGIPFPIRQHEAKPAKSISFVRIKQHTIRQEIKKVIYHELRIKALGTVQAEITSINRFSKFLTNKYRQIESLQDLNREIMEDYLVFLRIESNERKSYVTDLKHLKALLESAAEYLECDRLYNLLIKDDIGKAPKTKDKSYSDEELFRLNQGFLRLDKQIGRVLLLHQIMNTRISDILTLKQDSIFKNPDGKWCVKIKQTKTKMGQIIEIGEDGKKLFWAACNYTNHTFGKQEYVFVDEQTPSRPMKYSRVAYHFRTMVTKYNMVDDHGKPFGVGTHRFRSSASRIMSEAGVSDDIIAKTLGHKGMSSVGFYRKPQIRDITKDMKSYIEEKNKQINGIIAEW